jgi:hypothetical protein
MELYSNIYYIQIKLNARSYKCSQRKSWFYLLLILNNNSNSPNLKTQKFNSKFRFQFSGEAAGRRYTWVRGFVCANTTKPHNFPRAAQGFWASKRAAQPNISSVDSSQFVTLLVVKVNFIKCRARVLVVREREACTFTTTIRFVARKVVADKSGFYGRVHSLFDFSSRRPVFIVPLSLKHLFASLSDESEMFYRNDVFWFFVS